MATAEVLRPQDCLIGRIRVPPPASFSRRKSNYGNLYSSCKNNINNNYNYNYYANSSRSSRKQMVRSEKPDQKKRFVANQPEPLVSKRSSSDDLRAAVKVEKVTILRRGESLDSKIKSEALKKEGGGLVACGTQRLGPDPGMVPKRIGIVDVKVTPPTAAVAGKADVYAGSAFAVSPAPSSLPLPSFSKKKQVSAVVVDDSATRDLRRLLRID